MGICSTRTYIVSNLQGIANKQETIWTVIDAGTRQEVKFVKNKAKKKKTWSKERLEIMIKSLIPAETEYRWNFPMNDSHHCYRQMDMSTAAGWNSWRTWRDSHSFHPSLPSLIKYTVVTDRAFHVVTVTVQQNLKLKISKINYSVSDMDVVAKTWIFYTHAEPGSRPLWFVSPF